MSTKWEPGRSGNPNGRPRGSGEVAKLRMEIAERLPEVINILVQKALSGDTAAARLLLERTVAPLRAQETLISFPILSGTFTDQGRAVLEGIASEEIDPGRGIALIAAITNLARVSEIDELTQRVTSLEERAKCQA